MGETRTLMDATVQFLHDAAMRQADDMLAERAANDLVSAQVSAEMAFESELAALRRAHDKRVSTATRAILLKSLYALAIEAFCPEARDALSATPITEGRTNDG